MVPLWLEKSFYVCTDALAAVTPRSLPSLERLLKTKIISHRGERDDKTVFENTFAAYDPLLKTKVTGIEFDIRWSKDDVPMVFHDQDGQRLFGDPTLIREQSCADIQKKHPCIASLKQFVERYAERLHFMIELKKESFELSDKHNQILKDILAPLRAIKDYHLLSLHPEMFDVIDFAPSKAYFPVSIFHPKAFSDLVLKRHYAGLMGHFALLPKRILDRHAVTGAGHIASKNCLFREINRGVEWIFTNQAVKIQTILNQAIASYST